MPQDDATPRLDRSAGTTAGEPGEPEVVVLPTPEAAAQAAAERIVAALTAAIDARGIADWATTGGSSPAGIYRALVSPGLRDRVAWDRVRLWWGDDRFVRRTDPLSNVRPADELLLAPGSGVSIPPDRVHAMPMDDAIDRGQSPAWVAERYAAEVDRLVRAGPGGSAAFDIVLVGIGGDGHLLSVFPDSAVWDADATAIAVPAPTHIEPPVDRVTLHPPQLFLQISRIGEVDVTPRRIHPGDQEAVHLPRRMALELRLAGVARACRSQECTPLSASAPRLP